MFLKTFRWPLGVTVLVLLGALVLGGPQALAIVAILGILEISLSFDNAVVNATVLQRMSPYWQKLFLTVGIVVAVFGMRLVFPLLIVGVTSHLGPVQVVDLALNHPGQYADELTSAHPAIAAFGGLFLLMIFLDFVLETREVTWVGPLERGLARVGKLDQLSVIVSLGVLIVLGNAVDADARQQVLIAGAAGLATYIGVSSLAALFEGADDDDAVLLPDASAAQQVRVPDALVKGGLFSFLYLEVLDASFSFDGVIGAFAITQEIFVIAAGLGVGAMYIRSLTVYLVEKGTLEDYAHLEHGAHYAIGALAILLFVSIQREVPELVTGLIGVGFIGLSLLTSVVRNRRTAEPVDVPA